MVATVTMVAMEALMVAVMLQVAMTVALAEAVLAGMDERLVSTTECLPARSTNPGRLSPRPGGSARTCCSIRRQTYQRDSR